MYKEMTYFCSIDEQEKLWKMSEEFGVKVKVVLEFCLHYKYELKSKQSIRSSPNKKPKGRCVNFTADEKQFNLLIYDDNKKEMISKAIADTYKDWQTGKMNKIILKSYFPHL
ncbi:hypothetical protein [Aquitalea pelogenes]|uniref:hypothetical protein n=1 Tax=Aquitalea pelogenes TaxID=1293573 RepID=UPI0035B00BC2